MIFKTISRWLKRPPNPDWENPPIGSLISLEKKDIEKLLSDVASSYIRKNVGDLDRTLSKDFKVHYRSETERAKLKGIGDKWIFLNSLYRGNEHGTNFDYYNITLKNVISKSPEHWKVVCETSYKANEYSGNVLEDTIEQCLDIKIENGNAVVTELQYGYAYDV